VVDDDANLCHLTRLLLTQYGYTVLYALSAEAALQVSARHAGRIDLLLADIAMAGTSGPQLAQEIRVARPNMHLLFMSGLVTEKNFQGVLGGSFIRKPFSPSGLIDKIEVILYPDSRQP
jgi:DNA-binding response OmpR family regulator